MKWDQALALEIVVPKMSLSLIIVGKTKEGLPFFFEDNFILQKVNAEQMVTTIEFQTRNPLEDLHDIGFIEISFRERGILYYAFVEMLQLSATQTVCSLTLSVPHEFRTFENRRANRIQLDVPTSLTCRVIGVRKTASYQGEAFFGLIHDISAGGLSFVTNTRIFYPLLLELSFVLPNDPHTYILHGEIVRVTNCADDSYRLAVEFRNIPESTAQLLYEYCSQSPL
ncbi:PilZ domain-containing protein [Paenibacillus sp. 1_12]|uniref:PilZ domain-containing protein n=1 Tax=Paenibacillus sp. 1_12 TaxID=1566278 RepID=UPI0008F25360|nr:PilZ domain-containing protein [Paenibacillus sp. 1_12]SFK80042.1 PilZ domain-containing protein [Paenibacillus sp. 1_12]